MSAAEKPQLSLFDLPPEEEPKPDLPKSGKTWTLVDEKEYYQRRPHLVCSKKGGLGISG